MTEMRTPRHNTIAFFALATLRARKGQFNAKTRSATIATLSQCVKALRNYETEYYEMF